MTKYLDAIGAPAEFADWADRYPDKDNLELWNLCRRGDWMMWLLGETAAGEPWEASRRNLVKAGINCLSLLNPQDDLELLLDYLKVLASWADGYPVADELVRTAKGISEKSLAYSLMQETGGKTGYEIAAIAAFFAAYVPAYAMDVGPACARVVNYVVETQPSYRELLWGKCADLVRVVIDKPPKMDMKDVRSYRVRCPACTFWENIVVADPSRNGWRVARNKAYYIHDVEMGGLHGLTNPIIERVI